MFASDVICILYRYAITTMLMDEKKQMSNELLSFVY